MKRFNWKRFVILSIVFILAVIVHTQISSIDEYVFHWKQIPACIVSVAILEFLFGKRE